MMAWRSTRILEEAGGFAAPLAHAEEAVRWAASRNGLVPKRTNYAQLLEEACRICSRPEPPDADRLRSAAASHGAKPSWWPCLSRLLLMDEPALAAVIGLPHYQRDLDSPSGSALLRIWFRRITGRPPAVRTWQHAREKEAL